MKVRKIPMRSCVITKEKCEKKDLLRIVRTPSQEVIIDLIGKANGRGAYIKKSIDVVEKAQKTRALEHHLNVIIPDNIYEEMKHVIEK